MKNKGKNSSVATDVTTEILDTITLKNIIWKVPNSPDRRFFSVEDGGVFKYSALFHTEGQEDQFFFPVIRKENLTTNFICFGLMPIK